MIEILYMLGDIQRRYVIDESRYESIWYDHHRPLADMLLDKPPARVVVSNGIPDAPYLEYGARLPDWAEHPELARHQWLCAYDRPGSAKPIYIAWLIPRAGLEPYYMSAGAAMIAALTGGGTDGSNLLPEIEAAQGNVLIGGYTGNLGPDAEMVARLVSESLSCLALLMVGEVS